MGGVVAFGIRQEADRSSGQNLRRGAVAGVDKHVSKVPIRVLALMDNRFAMNSCEYRIKIDI